MTTAHGTTPQSVLPPAEAANRYTAPKQTNYDFVVIGGGSAGLPGASLAAALGASVALLERDKLGGECLYTGCVPSKALLHVARAAAQMRAAQELGLRAQLEPVDLGAVADRVQRVIDEVYADTDAAEHYIEQGIDVVIGATRFLSPKAVSVNGHTITAKHFLLATGSHPAVPPTPGLSEAGYLTNETVFSLRTLPARLAVIGGGPIGCELGQAFARLGSHVTILQRPAHLLPKDEAEAAAVLRARLEHEGVAVVTSAEVQRVSRRADGAKVVEVQTEHGPAEYVVDEILVAIGRAPNVSGLDLEAAGITYDPKKGVTVDANMRTSNSRVYAAGDVTGGYLFTHAAAAQSRTAVRNALFPGQSKIDERVMPWVTFTEPEVAHVGLTEAEARQQHGSEVRAYTQPMRAVDRAVTEGETAGFTKLICLPDGKLLGATIVGPAAGEFINEVAVAMTQDINLRDLATTTHVYPTVALSLQQAAGQFSIERTQRQGYVKLLRMLGG